MSREHKIVSKALNYFDHFVPFVSAVSGCVSISAFASLVGVPIGIAISTLQFLQLLQELKSMNICQEKKRKRVIIYCY